MTAASQDIDRRAAAVIRRSLLVGGLERLLTLAAAAGETSVVRISVSRAARWINRQTIAARVRLIGAVTAIASATALAGQRLASQPEPIVWMVPAFTLALGLLLCAVSYEGSSR